MNKNSVYLLQDTLIQHSELDRLNPYAVNTMRLVTVKRPDSPTSEPYVLVKLIRVGTKKCVDFDNTTAGGFGVGIYDDGRLKEDGFQKAAFGIIEKSHPNTGVIFGEFRLPDSDKAIEIAVGAHK